MKPCIKCGVEKPFSEFNKNKRKKDGLQPYCRECWQGLTSGYRANNLEHYRELRSTWMKNNPDRCLQTRGDLEACFYRMRQVNNGQTRKAISIEDLFSIWEEQDGKCALTGVQMTHTKGSGKVLTNVSLDRIEAGGPYIKSNVRLVCFIVNTMRHTMSDEELLWWCSKVVEFNKDSF